MRRIALLVGGICQSVPLRRLPIRHFLNSSPRLPVPWVLYVPGRLESPKKVFEDVGTLYKSGEDKAATLRGN